MILLLGCQLIVLAAVAAALAAAALRRRARRPGLTRGFHELAASLGAQRADRAEDRFSVDHAGQRVTARIAYALGGPEAIEVSVDLDTVGGEPVEGAGGYRESPRGRVRGRPEVRLSRATRWARIGDRLGIRRAIRTGDGALDRALRMETDAPGEDARRVVADADARRALLDLVEAGVDRITVNDRGGALTAAIVRPREELLNAFTFREVAEGLAAAARALPAFEGVAPPRPRGAAPPFVWAWLAMALVAALPVHGLGGLAPHPACCSRSAALSAGREGSGWDWIRGACCAPPGEPVRWAGRERPERSDVQLELIRIMYGKPPLMTYYLDVRLRNGADAPRWFLIPEEIDDEDERGPGGELSSIGARELRCWGRAVVADLYGARGGHARAVLLPPRADVMIRRLPFERWRHDSPASGRIEVVVARGLTIGGEPAEAWLGSSPLSDEVADAAYDAGCPEARSLPTRRISPLGPPPAVAVDEELRLRADVELALRPGLE